ncbi:formate dehydrogenase accessory sulfurtransferase FdhD [Georgenia sp. 10Sc9-8]|uniref:Sulfur carrier protein FdhD n=1 Tax=Georgenia halotolerans TaxID=3028317 RepID=A0ABT5U1D9_9MICO|nr:formate dehydrogenase accessory sulfurtransferase FdhD [Georgenia halotolerans]
MRATRRHPVVRLGADGSRRRRSDTLAGEEPLEVRVGGMSLSVTMRTPGDDVDLALGFLLSEGVLRSPDQVATVGYGPGVEADGTRSYNVVEVTLAAGVPAPDLSLERRVYTSSSCGICGTSSIEAVRKTTRYDVADDDLRVPLAEVLSLPDRLRERQGVFDRTGGVHAAALFRVEDDGPAELLCVREDVGRHNAVDKVLGWALRTDLLPARRCVLQLSGRASFELVQKAQMAGVPVLAAVSAPSALAVDLAAEAGMTLMGFSRGDSVNVYTGGDRVVG